MEYTDAVVVAEFGLPLKPMFAVVADALPILKITDLFPLSSTVERMQSLIVDNVFKLVTLTKAANESRFRPTNRNKTVGKFRSIRFVVDVCVLTLMLTLHSLEGHTTH